MLIIDLIKKINWAVSRALCILLSPYKKMLDTYPNLQQVTIALKNMTFGSTNGYNTVLSVLCGSYDPGEDWLTLQALFDQKLQTDMQRKIFLVRTIHILWMEKHGNLPWSIKDYSKDEINALFYETQVNSSDPLLKPKISVLSQDITFGELDIHLELEASYKLHGLALKIKANSIDLSVTNAVRWIKTNFFHYTTDWGMGVYGTDQFPDDLDHLFNERVFSCHEPVMLLSEILRSLNIPAVSLIIYSHGITYIPSLDRFVHGDHLASMNLAPVSLVLLTKDEIEQCDQADSMLYNLLYNKIEAVFDPPFLAVQLFTSYRINRVGSTLTLDIDFYSGVPVPSNIVSTLQTEAPQYDIQYDVATKKFTSQAVPIQSLESLS
jgi:hypothetical protein